MIDWLSQRIKKIRKIEKYSKPVKNASFKLDANENLLLDSNFLSQLVIKEARKIDLRKYPLELYDELYRKLSEYLKVSEKTLVIGNGSDQIIELLLSVIGEHKRVTLFTPTFSYFISRCQFHGISVSNIPLCPKDNTIRKSSFIKSAEKSNIVYLCSPNNPTGNQIERSIVQDILELKNVLVILDEAYVEFANYSMTKFVENYSNLAILRTFSKAFGLAGCRLGYLVTNKKIAHFIRANVQSPYPVNSLSLVIAISLLSNLKAVQKSVQVIKVERQRLFESISKIDFLSTYPSDSNFLFVRIKGRYVGVLDALEKHGVGVKVLGNLFGYGRCLRITVGTPKMNDTTIRALKSI
jgi:histidinol-phosphate aminotransferase